MALAHGASMIDGDTKNFEKLALACGFMVVVCDSARICFHFSFKTHFSFCFRSFLLQFSYSGVLINRIKVQPSALTAVPLLGNTAHGPSRLMQ